MAWENLPAIESNGVVYNLPLLTDSDIEWVAIQSSSGNYKVKSTLDITENSASTPFKYTTNPGDSEILQIHFSNNNNYLQFRGTGNYTLRINYFSNVGGGTLGVTMNVSNRGYYTSNLLYYYGIIINTETQQAKIWCFNQSASNQYQLVSGAYGDNTALSALYQNVINAIPVLYQWSSVSSISGKNGTLSLTQILNINDGEPVENVTNRGNLDFSKKTKVNTLVNSVYEPTYEEDASKATVEYEIPEAEYQYTKLVYKKKKIPKSPTDGTAIDIGADDTEVVVTNLEPSTVYYFVVFTNRTKSNAYKFRTGSYMPPEGIFKFKVTVDKALLDNDFKDFVSYEKVT